MQKEKKHLIICANEHTWKFDRPVVFLGEWCKLYNRKHIWQDMNYVVASPYGMSIIQKDADYKEVRSLENILIKNLCNTLNQHHGVHYSERFWTIVLGHWLRRYISIILNRVKTIEMCFNEYQITSTTLYNNENYSLATHDSYSAILASNDDLWNYKLNSRILYLLGLLHFPVENFNDNKSEGFHFEQIENNYTIYRKLFKFCFKVFTKLLSWFSRQSDAFIINTYLPKKEEIKLQLLLNQVPQFWNTPIYNKSEKPDLKLRYNLTNYLKSQKLNTNLHEILNELLFELLPICFLEGFNNLENLVKKLPYPKYPKFIFTCNNFDTDEVFKLWAAKNVEKGTKYFTGQHGNNYGTYRFLNPSIEEATADKFLTWGWTDDMPQHIPAFIFLTVDRKPNNFNPNGKLLLIEDMYYDRIDTWDRCAEHLKYLKDQFLFTKLLKKECLTQLIVRLHATYKYNNPSERIQWHEFNSNIEIDNGYKSINELIKESRLIIHGYDSTGILETLSLNIPTLAFWQNDFEHLRDNAKSYYQLLIDSGIVHTSAKSLANKVNEVWDNVDAWWGQSKVQDARLKFCERYAQTSKNPLGDLKKILNNY